MSNRLTNEMRGKIVNAVLHHKFDGLVKSLCKEYAALADRVYADAFKKIMKRIDDLPKGWLPEDGDIQCKFGTDVSSLQFNGKFFQGRWGRLRTGGGDYISTDDFRQFVVWPEHSTRRFPDNKKGGCVEVYDAHHTFVSELDELNDKRVSLVVDWYKARTEVGATVKKFTTIDKLLEAWPEVKPFTVGIAAQPKPQLPAVPVADLNRMLDLPV